MISGTITALVWVGLMMLYTWRRDKRLEKKIRRSIERIGLSVGVNDVGIIVRNDTHVQLTVRSVDMLLEATCAHPELALGASAGSLVLNYGGPAEVGSSRQATRGDCESRGFVTLPPYTSARWDWSTTKQREVTGYLEGKQFVGTKIVVEYMSLLRRPKILEVCPPDHGAAQMFNQKVRRI